MSKKLNGKNQFPNFKVKLIRYVGPTKWLCLCGHIEIDKEGQDIKRRCVCGRYMFWRALSPDELYEQRK